MGPAMETLLSSPGNQPVPRRSEERPDYRSSSTRLPPAQQKKPPRPETEPPARLLRGPKLHHTAAQPRHTSRHLHFAGTRIDGHSFTQRELAEQFWETILLSNLELERRPCSTRISSSSFTRTYNFTHTLSTINPRHTEKS